MILIVVPMEGMRQCRWSQPQFRPGAGADQVADAPWECVRVQGQERPIAEDDCVGCEHWTPDYIL